MWRSENDQDSRGGDQNFVTFVTDNDTEYLIIRGVEAEITAEELTRFWKTGQPDIKRRLAD